MTVFLLGGIVTGFVVNFFVVEGASLAGLSRVQGTSFLPFGNVSAYK